MADTVAMDALPLLYNVSSIIVKLEGDRNTISVLNGQLVTVVAECQIQWNFKIL
jgi:hypothetical protein